MTDPRQKYREMLRRGGSRDRSKTAMPYWVYADLAIQKKDRIPIRKIVRIKIVILNYLSYD